MAKHEHHDGDDGCPEEPRLVSNILVDGEDGDQNDQCGADTGERDRRVIDVWVDDMMSCT